MKNSFPTSEERYSSANKGETPMFRGERVVGAACIAFAALLVTGHGVKENINDIRDRQSNPGNISQEHNGPTDFYTEPLAEQLVNAHDRVTPSERDIIRSIENSSKNG